MPLSFDILVVANGTIPAGPFLDQVLAHLETKPQTPIICADGGATKAFELDLTPTLVVGDGDSMSAQTKQKIDQAGIPYHLQPTTKDQTDFELALLETAHQPEATIAILGSFGHRVDQSVSALLASQADSFQAQTQYFVHGNQLYQVLQPGNHFMMAEPGHTVSLVPLSAEVTEVAVTSCQYPLDHETLYRHQSRGVSNLVTAEHPSLSFTSGQLLVCTLIQ